MKTVEIPLTSRPERFSVSLLGILYNFHVYWLVPGNCWVLDIADQAGNLLVGGLALVTGCNLLEQFDYLGIGGALGVVSDWLPTPDAVPGFDDFGRGGTGHLYFVVS